MQPIFIFFRLVLKFFLLNICPKACPCLHWVPVVSVSLQTFRVRFVFGPDSLVSPWTLSGAMHDCCKSYTSHEEL